MHDIGLQIVRDETGSLGFQVYVGGGQGRTPMIAPLIREFLPEQDLLTYVDAILRVYNLEGRRDNKYKARIKILTHEKGHAAFQEAVEVEFAALKKAGEPLTLPHAELARIGAYFAMPDLPVRASESIAFAARKNHDADFAAFVKHNTIAHKIAGYCCATISLKAIGAIPGDASATQMECVADLAARYSQDEIRVSHEQNLILPHVAIEDLPALYDALKAQHLATSNVGLVSDIICCPGLDYCSLATARSIPVAQRISNHFENHARAQNIGSLKIKISGCINACGHHHVGHIGILGLERKGVETYQITLGGSGAEDCAIGEIVGPGFSYEDVVSAVETIVATYERLRLDQDEPFLSAYRRLGMGPFRAALYPAKEAAE